MSMMKKEQQQSNAIEEIAPVEATATGMPHSRRNSFHAIESGSSPLSRHLETCSLYICVDHSMQPEFSEFS